MLILTVNAGSSSIRLDAMVVEDGPPRRVATHHGPQVATNCRGDPPGQVVADTVAPASGGRAIGLARDVLAEVLSRWNLGRPDAVAHRVVHGGRNLTRPCLLTQAVLAEIDGLSPLAPLHNPPALAWIGAARELLGKDVPQAAVFDTGFYADMPGVASMYALPQALTREHPEIRRYGFHGIAHEAMWRRWWKLEAPQESEWRRRAEAATPHTRVISFQLGAGCSVTAVRDGKPIDTSMGFSPLEGLVMASRSGDVDPGLLLHLQRAGIATAVNLEHLLNEESGLLGVSGISADMRELLESGAGAARLAVDLYCYRARKFLGAYLAALGGADAILFGGGVGENAPAVRERILEGLEWAGIALDPERNRAAVGREARIDTAAVADERLQEVAGAEMRIEHHRTGASVWVIPVDEAAILAEEAAALLSARPTNTTRKDRS